MFDAFLSHLYWLNGQNSSRSPSTEESRLSHWCLCSSCGCTATHRCEQPNGGAAGLQCVQKWRTLVVKTRGCHGKWPIYRWFTYIYLFKCWFLLIFLLAMFDYQTVHTPKMVFKDKEQLGKWWLISGLGRPNGFVQIYGNTKRSNEFAWILIFFVSPPTCAIDFFLYHQFRTHSLREARCRKDWQWWNSLFALTMTETRCAKMGAWVEFKVVPHS